MTFPAVLAAGPVAGYLIGQHILVRRLNAPEFCVPLLTVLGFFGSILQIVSLIKKVNAIEVSESQKDL